MKKYLLAIAALILVVGFGAGGSLGAAQTPTATDVDHNGCVTRVCTLLEGILSEVRSLPHATRRAAVSIQLEASAGHDQFPPCDAGDDACRHAADRFCSTINYQHGQTLQTTNDGPTKPLALVCYDD